tara:strand:+ start:130 stop:465 length:336 start_codon:yes stop_codon:yes gene_type:complete
MTEYSDMIETKRKQLAAEEWAVGIRSIHTHKLSSMWYDKRPEDTKNHSVTDTTYNDLSIERRLHNGALVFFNEDKLTGKALIDEWEKATYNLCVCGTKNCPTEYSCTTHGY